MASSQNKAHQRRTRPNWLLCCFGFPAPKPPSDEIKKARKPSGGRKKWFRLCLPKVRIISFRKRKVGLFDTKAAAIKATQSFLLQASKAQQLKKLHHNNQASNNQEQQQVKGVVKESLYLKNSGSGDNKSDDATCHGQDRKPKAGPVSKSKPCCLPSKVTRDSLIGLSLMAVALVIMSIWGRFCAILCMSAWLYCVPLLRPTRIFRVAPSTENLGLDLDSKLYKKKVVLGGLLQRDHKVTKVGLIC